MSSKIQTTGAGGSGSRPEMMAQRSDFRAGGGKESSRLASVVNSTLRNLPSDGQKWMPNQFFSNGEYVYSAHGFCEFYVYIQSVRVRASLSDYDS